jgi:hypothetical protein
MRSQFWAFDLGYYRVRSYAKNDLLFSVASTTRRGYFKLYIPTE